MASKKKAVKRPPRRDLNIFRLRNLQKLAQHPAAVEKDTNVVGPLQPNNIPFPAALYIREAERKPPLWKAFLDQAFVNLDTHIQENAANSALLFVEVDGALYALVFGYGRSLLKPEFIARGFGSRAALGLIGENELQVVDTRVIDFTTIARKTQSSRRLSMDELELDRDRAILGGVFGYPEDESDALTRIAGADSVHLNPRGDFERLPEFIRIVAQSYDHKRYTSKHSWIDRIKPINDSKLESELDAKLLAKFKNASRDVEISYPSSVPVEKGVRLHLPGSPAEELVDGWLSLEELKEKLPDDVDADGLRRLRIHYTDPDGNTLGSAPVADWLAFECKHQGKRFALNEGVYYELQDSFAADVEAYCDTLKPTALAFPEWRKAKHANENKYNKFAVGQLSPAALLDCHLVNPFGSGTVEPCDVFVKRGRTLTFVHVKKFYGSAELSHQFSQGAVAADAFMNSPKFRAAVRDEVPSKLQKWIDVDAAPKEPTVAFVIASPGGQHKSPNDLPFFSKVNLRMRARDIQRLQASVKVQFVKFVE